MFGFNEHFLTIKICYNKLQIGKLSYLTLLTTFTNILSITSVLITNCKLGVFPKTILGFFLALIFLARWLPGSVMEQYKSVINSSEHEINELVQSITAVERSLNETLDTSVLYVHYMKLIA